jgi:hypothetical protein
MAYCALRRGPPPGPISPGSCNLRGSDNARTRGSPRRSRTAKASRISRHAVKSDVLAGGSSACFADPHSRWSPPLAPLAPQRIAPLCSPASQLLRVAASGTIPRHPNKKRAKYERSGHSLFSSRMITAIAMRPPTVAKLITRKVDNPRSEDNGACRSSQRLPEVYGAVSRSRTAAMWLRSRYIMLS